MTLMGKISLIWFATILILTGSCVQIPPVNQEVKMIVSPYKLSVHSGSVDKVYVKLLDRSGGPIFGAKVKAISSSPSVAIIEPLEAITDATGRVVFTVKGISPGTANITLFAAGYEAKVEVIFIEH